MNLLLQAVIFVVIALGMYARLKHSYVKHAAMMVGGIVLHTISIFAIMLPSLLSFHSPLENPLTNFALVTLVHAAVGSLVELLGLLLVTVWLLHAGNIKRCFGRKGTMRITTVLWLIELALGVYVYVMLYLPT